jgi:hypothetical protein
MPSTVIDHFKYNQNSKILTITFNSGNVYAYQHVPDVVYTAMKKSISKGKFFNLYIKDRFEFEKLDTES